MAGFWQNLNDTLNWIISLFALVALARIAYGVRDGWLYRRSNFSDLAFKNKFLLAGG